MTNTTLLINNTFPDIYNIINQPISNVTNVTVGQFILFILVLYLISRLLEGGKK